MAESKDEAFLKAIEQPLLERQLTVVDLQKSLEERDITRFVKIIGGDWYHFGTGMNIEHHKLDEIKADRSNQAERIIAMLNYLIEQENAKYESILYALYEMDNQNPNLIKVLEYLARKLGKKTHSEGFLQKHSDYLNNHSITLVDLQKKCTHSHAEEIARDLTEWRTTQTYLEIPEDEEEKIEANNKNDEAAMRLCLLETWLKVHSDRATYLKLFEALHLTNRTDLIEKGLRLLEEDKLSRRQDEGVESDSSDALNDEDMRFLCGCGHCSLSNFLENGCPNPWEHAHFPLLNIKKMKRREKLTLLSRLTEDERDISEKFALLTTSVYCSLKKLDYFDINELKIFLMAQQKFFYLSEEKRIKLQCDLSSASNVETVLMFLLTENYISWFNYPLLHSIVKRFKVCETEYLEYVDNHLTSFLRRSLFEIPSHYRNISDDPQKSGQFFLKIDVPSSDDTLRDSLKADILLPLRKHVSSTLGIAIDAFEFCSYSKGCIQFVFAAPLGLLRKIFPLSDRVLKSLSAFNYKGLFIKTVQYDYHIQTIPKNEVKKEESDFIIAEAQSTRLTDVFTMFASLIVELYRSIKESQMELQSVKEFLSRLNSQQLRKSGDKPLLHKVLSQIEDMPNIADLLLFLSQFWSFFNYKLLEKLVNKFDSYEAKAKLKEYILFLDALRVVEMPPLIQPFFNTDSYHSDLLEVRLLPNSLQALSAEELLHIHVRVATVFRIEYHALLLQEIKIADDILEYLVPVCVQLDVDRMTSLSLSSLRHDKVIGISFKDFNCDYSPLDKAPSGTDTDSGFCTTSSAIDYKSHSRTKHTGATARIQNEGSTVMYEEHENKITPSLDGKPTHACIHKHEAMKKKGIREGAQHFVKTEVTLKKNREESKTVHDLELSLTTDSYKDTFKHALQADKIENNAKLTKWCNGNYDLTVLDKIPDWFRSKSRQSIAHVAYIDIDDHKVQCALQESDYICLIYAPNEMEMCKVKIAPQNFRNTKPILYLLLSKKDMEKLSEFPSIKAENGIVFQNTKVLFQAKHQYYNSLHEALAQIPDFMIQKILPSPGTFKQSTTLTFTHTQSISGECEISQLSIDDADRLRLLQHILDSPPDVPIVISGAFGTGKTTLLARATYEFVKDGLSSSSQKRILICTHHTNNADAYMEKYFIPTFQDKDDIQIVRVMRQSKKGETKFSNIQYVEFTHLEINNRLVQTKCVVFITTFMTSLKLVNQIKSKNFYFTHIILDEAAQVREPEAVAPLCLGNEDTKIIMAGDFKQVGPTVSIQATDARRSGLNISLLERLWKLYREIGGPLLQYTGELNRNYRCHPLITKLLSDLLYTDPIADSKISRTVVTHPLAPFPCVFYCSDCCEISEAAGGGRSRKRMDEAAKQMFEKDANGVIHELKFYFGKWPEEWKKIGIEIRDVCIVSGSRSQLNFVRQRISKDKTAPQGAEYLTSYNIQGFEFQAILLSTYESLDENGLPHDQTKSLCNPHVFNTVVSRSRALVVAVGDPLKLLVTEEVMGSKERCWREYLKCCLEHNSLHFPKGFSQADQQFMREVIQSNV